MGQLPHDGGDSSRVSLRHGYRNPHDRRLRRHPRRVGHRQIRAGSAPSWKAVAAQDFSTCSPPRSTPTYGREPDRPAASWKYAGATEARGRLPHLVRRRRRLRARRRHHRRHRRPHRRRAGGPASSKPAKGDGWLTIEQHVLADLACREKRRRRTSRPDVQRLPARTAARLTTHPEEGTAMSDKAAMSPTTGLEDPERVTVALTRRGGSRRSRSPDTDVLDQGSHPARHQRSRGRYRLRRLPRPADPDEEVLGCRRRAPGCPICFDARSLDPDTLVENATLGGTVQLWEWIGDESATTFSY